MDTDFQARLKAAQQTEERAKEMDGGEFPPDPPPGVYDAVMQTCKLFVSSKGKPMCQRVFVIDGGESHGMQARDFLNLEQDFLIARLRAFVEVHDHSWPEQMFDYEQSEKDDTWVFTPEAVDVISAIEGEARQYKIDFSQRVVRDRVFNSVSILEVGESDVGAKATESGDESGDGGEDTALLTELLAFCVDDGNVDDVDDSDDLDAVKEKIGQYTFWPAGCDAKALHKIDGMEDASPDDGISAESIELLQRAGLGECIEDVPMSTKRKPASRKRSK